MQSLKYPRWGAYAPQQPGGRVGRLLAAAVLRRASAALARLARQLVPAAARWPRHEPQVEFHSEAGAPEGALYVDGKFVGWIAGVRRL